MASIRNKYTRSRIYPEIIWRELISFFVIIVPKTDESLIEFIASGVMEFIHLPRLASKVAARMHHSSSPLRSQLLEDTWSKGKLKPTKSSRSKGSEIKAYFYGSIYLPDEDKIAVIVGSIPPLDQNQIAINPEAQQKATDLFENHKLLLKEWRKEEDLYYKKNDDFVENLPEEHRELLRKMSAYDVSYIYPPRIDAIELIPYLTNGIFIDNLAQSLNSRYSRIVTALENSSLAPPRDGTHEAMLFKSKGNKFSALATWAQRNIMPSYPEVIATVTDTLTKSFIRPRRNDISPPSLDFPRDHSAIRFVEGLDEAVRQESVEFSDIYLPFDDLEERAQNARSGIKDSGFDVFAWYQPFHVWDDATWGIYLSAEKIDDFACTLLDDLKGAGERSHQLAMILALQLVYQHELFHAKVEACLTWLELLSSRPRFIRYSKDVYQALKGTDDWYEEALANWTSAEWARIELPLLKERGLIKSLDSVERVIHANLDLSPPGYRNWRIGSKQNSWRSLSSELVNGKVSNTFKGKLLPTESLLLGPLPFDFETHDIPTRIIGSGVVVDSLLSSPASFATPTRREIERALKYMGYSVDKRRGKGSHELWAGNDSRSFPVPSRDPLSRGVFNSFLHHFGIDKMKYVEKIRPQL